MCTCVLVCVCVCVCARARARVCVCVWCVRVCCRMHRGRVRLLANACVMVRHAAPGCMEECWTAPPSLVPRPRFLGHTMDIWRVTSCLLTYLLMNACCDVLQRRRLTTVHSAVRMTAEEVDHRCRHWLACQVESTSPAEWNAEPCQTPCWSPGRWLWRMGWRWAG